VFVFIVPNDGRVELVVFSDCDAIQRHTRYSALQRSVETIESRKVRDGRGGQENIPRVLCDRRVGPGLVHDIQSFMRDLERRQANSENSLRFSSEPA
jgi:hypothetical protein